MNQTSEQVKLLQSVKEAQEGSHQAFSQLLHDFQPLIWKLVKQYSLQEADTEDLYQEATLAFYRAIMDYRPEEKFAGFALFAKVCMTNRLIDCVRKMAPARAAELSVDLDSEEDDIPDETQNPSLHVMEEESYLMLCKRIRAVLSEEENEVWTLHFAGQSAAEIAKRLGKEQKSVENALYRVRRKLKNVFKAQEPEK